MRVEKSRGFTTFLPGRFFIQVRNVKVRVGAKQELRVLQLLLIEQRVPLHGDDEPELATSHAFKFPLQLICVATEHPDDLRIFDAVKQLDGLRVVHHAGHSSVQGLSTQ